MGEATEQAGRQSGMYAGRQASKQAVDGQAGRHRAGMKARNQASGRA